MDGMPLGQPSDTPLQVQEFGQIFEQLEAGENLELANNRTILEKIRRLQRDSIGIYTQTVDRLRRLGIADHIILAAMGRSKRTGAPLLHELASSSQLDLHAYYCLLAADLGLRFENSINPKRILIDATATIFRPGRTVQVCCRDERGGLVLHMAPDERAEKQLSALFTKKPAMRERFCICDPKTILAAVEGRTAEIDVHAAINRLRDRWPHLSAKETLIPWQAFVLGVLVVLFPLCLWASFWPTLFVIHIFATLFFGASVGIRIAAWDDLGQSDAAPANLKPSSNYPVYSVLVALNKEAAVVAQLVRAMSRLDWPMSRLEVLYVCEADDAETIAALGQLRLPSSHRIIAVPVALPRTKPKALNYALEKCTGDFVVIYDAEDRPHPQQLREAWSRFCEGPGELACLQAPLDISNADQSWISRLFAFEYAAHFHGLLPYLCKIRAPLPLGGTSNHFRKSALTESMSWDPYNVTEDADLGIRFHKLGYHCGVLTLPTLEDAPTDIHQWIPQRTRWIKGWMQTYLVHNRKIINRNKSKSYYVNIVFQILMGSFIFSPILYGVSILEILYFIFTIDQDNTILKNMIISMDVSIFILGHIGYALLAITCWRRLNGGSAISIVLSLPLYWLLASYAAWRAVWKLITVPHQWEKTSHQAAFSKKTKS